MAQSYRTEEDSVDSLGRTKAEIEERVHLCILFYLVAEAKDSRH